MNLIIVVLFAVAYCYPIVVTNTDLSSSDLFINQIDLMNKIRQQENKKVILINIQTSHQDNEIFQSKLLKKIDNLKNFKKLLKSKSSFVSPFVDYSPIQFTQGLQKDNQFEVQTIPMNFQNLKALDKFAQQQDAILIVLFSKISSNVKVLEEITETSEPSDQIVAVELADESELTSNTIYTVTSNQLTGYIVFFVSIFALWIAVQCNGAIQTPERFSKQNYYIGKES
ncbi:unnamed protein product (macronuclear) [Paramecium tetraurelia]|uniref:Transmembrane protein n=1 Tax=Paramecium tetraurelia TaxID=5888 RepID=A0BDB6_PARTE|nr:uncharacterized protein GSPATT00004627001 [Paramecium tetraurelia]CAK56533.1 unnamed protein product [Paramecium tetraurelia]|eukprot:XP_001423931.1 hypothetical protein (macronuclear) [Paramecium tetraurelia strain d4-2]